jgi:ATP/ADP translocase
MNKSPNNKDNENLQQQNSIFNTIKNFIFPSQTKDETILGFGLGIMFVATIYIYTVSRILKDNLVIAELSGEAVPFMKGLVAIAALAFGVIYVLGISFFNRRNLFNITLITFLSFFGIFGLIIFPLKEKFLLSNDTIFAIKDWLIGNTGSFFNINKFIKMILTGSGIGFFFSLTNLKFKNILNNIIKYIAIIFAGYSFLYYFSGPKLANNLHLSLEILRIWPFALYYIFSEMWGAYCTGLLFWNFANYQVNLTEAKRIYPFIVLIAQIGQIGAGIFGQKLVTSSHFVIWVTLSTLLSGFLILFLHEYLFRTSGREQQDTVIKNKKKSGLIDSLKAMMSSPIIFLTSSIVGLYGITCNILETYWKISLSKLSNTLYPQSKELAKEYFTYNQSQMIVFIGFSGIVSAILGGFLMRKMGWRFSALITPFTVAIGTICLFSLNIFNNLNGSNMGVHLLYIAMII